MTDTTLTPYDSADYLKTEAQQTAYLRLAMEEAGDDPAFMIHALGVVARARNTSLLAKEVGLSRAGLYKALSKEGNPSFSTVVGIAKALGLELTFRPAA